MADESARAESWLQQAERIAATVTEQLEEIRASLFRIADQKQNEIIRSPETTDFSIADTEKLNQYEESIKRSDAFIKSTRSERGQVEKRCGQKMERLEAAKSKNDTGLRLKESKACQLASLKEANATLKKQIGLQNEFNTISRCPDLELLKQILSMDIIFRKLDEDWFEVEIRFHNVDRLRAERQCLVRFRGKKNSPFEITECDPGPPTEGINSVAVGMGCSEKFDGLFSRLRQEFQTILHVR